MTCNRDPLTKGVSQNTRMWFHETVIKLRLGHRFAVYGSANACAGALERMSAGVLAGGCAVKPVRRGCWSFFGAGWSTGVFR